MKRKLMCLLLCALLLLFLSACGGRKTAEEAPAASPVSSSGISFREAYPSYAAVRDALVSEISGRIDAHNNVLRAEQPGSYFFNSDLLLLAFAPFGSSFPDLGRDLSDDMMDAVLAGLQARWPDAALSLTAPGRYEATYTYVDRTSGTDINRSGKCVWECDGSTGALRVCSYLDGLLQEYTEFVPQSGNRYLLSTMKDRAVVEYRGGSVSALWFEHRIYEAPLGSFPGDVRSFFPESGCFPDGTCSIDQIVGDVDAEYVFTLENGTAMYKGKIAQPLLDVSGNQIGISWLDTGTVTLRR